MKKQLAITPKQAELLLEAFTLAEHLAAPKARVTVSLAKLRAFGPWPWKRTRTALEALLVTPTTTEPA